MTTACLQPVLWPPQDAEDSNESDGTLTVPPEECPYVVTAPDTTDYAQMIEEQKREYEKELLGAKLLDEAVGRIGRLAPLEVDGETQRLLDAAIAHQATGQCDNVEAWASRLADDVKDADD